MLLVDGDPTQGIDVLKDYERNFVVIIIGSGAMECCSFGWKGRERRFVTWR
jgi:hypothetical protein